MLTEYASDDLAPLERAIVDDHLDECAHCREELALARNLAASMAARSAAACPEHVSRNIMAMVDTEASSARRARGTWWQAAVLAAAAVLLAVIIPRQLPDHDPAPTPELAVAQARQDLIWTLAFTAEVIERSEMQTIANVWRQVRSRTPDSHAATINGGQG
jgi:anti-sigma factor RsiW